MNQRDPKTGRYLGNKNSNKSTGFKKTQNHKCQANQMQGNQSRAFMNRDTWNVLGDSDKKAWDQLSDQAKTKIAVCHFNKGKEYAAQDSEANKMEAKEHDLIFDDSDEELEAKQHDIAFDDSDEDPDAVEVNNFETLQMSNAESTRKMSEDEGVDFDTVLQALQANTRIQVHTHELLDSDSSDVESAADLEVNTVHNFRPKIKGLLVHWSSATQMMRMKTPLIVLLLWRKRWQLMQEVRSTTLTHRKSSQSSRRAQPKGMLQFSDSEAEDEAEETVAVEGKDMSESTSNEGVVGEQEGNFSGLTNSDADQRRLFHEFCAQDGPQHFRIVKTNAIPKTRTKSFSKRRPRSRLTRKRPK